MLRRTPLKRTGWLRKKAGKKPRKINLKKKLWKVFSEYIRRRAADLDGYVACVSCGVSKPWNEVHAGHYIPKSLGTGIYFCEQNVHPQCVSCNLWRHGNQNAYALYLVKTYGPTILETLDAKRRETVKIRPEEYLALIDHYREKLEAL
jgi:hypothetical protein